MKNTQLYVNADDDLKRRLTLAAAKSGVPVTQYCLNAILQRLQKDRMLARENISSYGRNHTSKSHILEKIRKHREAIANSRNGEYIDVDAIMDQMHEERDKELMGLC